MKGNDKVIALLNDCLTAELTAVNQYFLHARMCENWGYERLWKRLRQESIDEMKHADRLIERVLYLDGLPNVQRMSKISVGENVAEMLRLDLEVEKASIKAYNDGVELSRSLGDNGTRELLEDLLKGSESYANWLETQLGLIEQVGLQNYLAQQIDG